MKINLDNKFKDFNFTSWKIFILGALSLAAGIYAYFFNKPYAGVNIKTQQPVISNGSILLVLGLGLLLIGLYRIIFKKKAFKSEMDIENEIGERQQELNRMNEYLNYLIKENGRKKKRKRLQKKAKR